jgi:putative membrane protein
MIDIILFCLLGLGLGIFLGLVPGMHINNILPLILLLFLSFGLEAHYVAVLIVSTAIAEIFTNFIPSIFLGAPEEDTSLSVLPGHRLLLEGRGYEAIKLTVIGGIGALLFTLAFAAIFAKFFIQIYPISRSYLHYLIILVIAFMILTEKNLRKMLSAILIIILSGFLGLITLNSSLSQQNILFPILAGLFGISTLVTSVSQRAEIPKQVEDTKLHISKASIIKSIILGGLAGVLVGFLPAIGISTAALIVQQLGGMGETRSFLVTLGGINIANEIFSLLTLFMVGNPRSGASVAVERVLKTVNVWDVILLIGSICFTAGIAGILTIFLGKKIHKYLEKINYRKLCISIIVFLVVMIYIFTGLVGILIGFTSTSIGLLCIYLGIKRSHCMGCLLIPAVIFFSGLAPQAISFLRI